MYTICKPYRYRWTMTFIIIKNSNSFFFGLSFVNYNNKMKMRLTARWNARYGWCEYLVWNSQWFCRPKIVDFYSRPWFVIPKHSWFKLVRAKSCSMFNLKWNWNALIFIRKNAIQLISHNISCKQRQTKAKVIDDNVSTSFGWCSFIKRRYYSSCAELTHLPFREISYKFVYSVVAGMWYVKSKIIVVNGHYVIVNHT